MSKTTTHTEYAAFVKLLPGGPWRKIHAFFLKSEEGAERAILEHKKLYPKADKAEYKIAKRTVASTTEDWHDL